MDNMPERKTVTMVFVEEKTAVSKEVILLKASAFGDPDTARFFAENCGTGAAARIEPRAGSIKERINIGILDFHFKKQGDAGLVLKMSVALDPMNAAYFAEMAANKTACAVTLLQEGGQITLPGVSQQQELTEEYAVPDDEMEDEFYDEEDDPEEEPDEYEEEGFDPEEEPV